MGQQVRRKGANSKAGKDSVPSRKLIRKKPQGNKKQTKNCLEKKNTTSFIKKYHSWPAALNIRQYQKQYIITVALL